MARGSVAGESEKMKLHLDRDGGILTVEEHGLFRDIPLYSQEAFELISKEWVLVGWAMQYYTTFRWLGLPILQLPDDLLRLQEVIASLRPDVIIETGVNQGGSILFHATLCEAMGNGRVVGIDIHIGEETRRALTSHALARRIHLIEGDSAAQPTAEVARRLIPEGASVMVILDSDHSKSHVARELETYAPLVTRGSCIVVTDGIMHDLAGVPGGQPSWVDDNPAAAAREFAAAHPEFEARQPGWPRNVTYFPDAWLWRKP